MNENKSKQKPQIKVWMSRGKKRDGGGRYPLYLNLQSLRSRAKETSEAGVSTDWCVTTSDLELTALTDKRYSRASRSVAVESYLDPEAVLSDEIAMESATDEMMEEGELGLGINVWLARFQLTVPKRKASSIVRIKIVPVFDNEVQTIEVEILSRGQKVFETSYKFDHRK